MKYLMQLCIACSQTLLAARFSCSTVKCRTFLLAFRTLSVVRQMWLLLTYFTDISYHFKPIFSRYMNDLSVSAVSSIIIWVYMCIFFVDTVSHVFGAESDRKVRCQCG